MSDKPKIYRGGPGVWLYEADNRVVPVRLTVTSGDMYRLRLFVERRWSIVNRVLLCCIQRDFARQKRNRCNHDDSVAYKQCRPSMSNRMALIFARGLLLHMFTTFFSSLADVIRRERIHVAWFSYRTCVDNCWHHRRTGFGSFRVTVADTTSTSWTGLLRLFQEGASKPESSE